MPTLENPLIISGNQILRDPFTGISPFYPQYNFKISNASHLDVASAIGAVRRADRASLPERQKFLNVAAEHFRADPILAEHVVRMTGMPIALIKNTLEDINRVFQEVPTVLSQRYKSLESFVRENPKVVNQEVIGQEIINSNISKLLIRDDGICYAITPGNDPRAVAIVAANLGYLGIPFIIRASNRDAIAPLIIEALISAGFDPHFCNLIYLNRDTADFEQKHFKMLDACAYVWTFGQSQRIDRTLRYRKNKSILSLDLADSGYDASGPQDLREILQNFSENEFNQRVRITPQIVDHFENKVVIRHESGNCAAILNGAFDTIIMNLLYPSLGYANVCTALKSLMVISDHDQTSAIADMLASLVVGDPLHDETQVGYIEPRNLDYLARLVQQNSLQILTYGGERLSAFQAKPLLITAAGEIPDFLGQEVPAYVLTTRTCQGVDEAVDKLNKHLGGTPRLGVSLLRLQEGQLEYAIPKINARMILINKPTSHLLPMFHEGNDYYLLLTTTKIMYD